MHKSIWQRPNGVPLHPQPAQRPNDRETVQLIVSQFHHQQFLEIGIDFKMRRQQGTKAVVGQVESPQVLEGEYGLGKGFEMIMGQIEASKVRVHEPNGSRYLA